MASATSWAAAVLLGVAAWAALAPPARLGDLAPVRDSVAAPVPDRRRALDLLVALGCGAAVWAFFGGRVGLVAGAVGAVLALRALRRVEPPAAGRRRARLARDLPTAVDLLAACLDAGEAPPAALRTVGRALRGPVEEELVALAHRLDLGVDPGVVWSELAAHAELGPLGRALGRAHESGASVSDVVHELAVELRERARAGVEERARALEVKVAAPLGLCLLPAFVVLGIVPMVVGLVATLAPS